MSHRPPAPSLRRLLAAAVAFQLGACAMLEAPAPASRPAPAAEDPNRTVAVGEEPPAASVTETTTGEGKLAKKTTRVDFDDRTIDGELSRPDGEYAEQRRAAYDAKYKKAAALSGQTGAEEDLGRTRLLQQKRVSTIQVIRGAQPGPTATPTTPPVRPAPVVAAPGRVLDPLVVNKAPEEKPREPEADPSDFLRHYGVNPTIETSDERFSTFAADVDTGSYTLSRGYLQRGQLPPEAAVRVEEFVNAFEYAYRAPEKEAFAVQVEAFPSPNRKGYHVLHLGLKGKEVSAAARKPASLVFTLDVSGSMASDNRLGLAKRALTLLLEQLDERDQVALVVYGDAARVVLPPTNATQKERIAAAIHSMRSEGSTNVQAGLELAYTVALKAFKPDGVNRVILCSDGVANNGITTADGIFAKVKARASEGITLTTVGFGMDEYNDVLMERLADQGDGQYAYVDKLDEARRIFVEQLTGTLQVIAKDVKLQLEFNPEAVARYRLLGFENRALSKQDFHDDKKDAGELGAGHSVTAVYEVKFKSRAPATFATFRARFKQPRAATSGLVEKALPMALVKDQVSASSGPARLSLVAAGFAEKLRGSYWARNLQWGELLELWETLPEGLKRQPRVEELRALLLSAKRLDTRPDRFESVAPLASMDFDRVPVLR